MEQDFVPPLRTRFLGSLPSGEVGLPVLFRLTAEVGRDGSGWSEFRSLASVRSVLLSPGKMPGLAAASPAPPEAQEKKPLKPCCACPETKKARDAWSVRSRGGKPGLPQLGSALLSVTLEL